MPNTLFEPCIDPLCSISIVIVLIQGILFLNLTIARALSHWLLAPNPAQMDSQFLHSLQEELLPPGMGTQSLLQKSTSAKILYPLSLLENMTFVSFLPHKFHMNASYWFRTLEARQFEKCSSHTSRPSDKVGSEEAGKKDAKTQTKAT